MSESDPRSWALKAEADLDMAKRALRGKRKYPEAAAFHAQQCAEKYLKAMLVSARVAFPKTHDLVLLNYLCRQNAIPTHFDESALQVLTNFSVRVRYPGEETTLEEAKVALEIAKSVRRFALRWLNMDV